MKNLSITTVLVALSSPLAVTLASAQEPIPLKDAKLNIEYNATDKDIGFQGFVDSEGWQNLTVTGPGGAVLKFEGLGPLSKLGVTELFFETVEPAIADVPASSILANLPAGNYTIEGPSMESGESKGPTSSIAWLTHDIPEGPALQAPAERAVVPAGELAVAWGAVEKSIKGDAVKIIAYQLIVEKDEPPHKHMIGKRGLSMVLPPTVTSITLPQGFLEPGTPYKWEVLAIEESGNQTLSSSEFRTE